MVSRPVLAGAAACLFAAPVTFVAVTSNAATTSPSAPSTLTSGSSMSSSVSATPSSGPSTAGASSSSTAQTGTATPAAQEPLPLHLDAKGAFARSALPSASHLFTTSELASVISAVRSTNGSDDTISLTMTGEKANAPSSLIVTMKRFGKTNDVKKAWASEKKLHEQRASQNQGLYTFFGENKHGAADSFTDGTTAHVLLQDGDAAGEIWFSGIGFNSLSSTHAASRSQYTSSVTPKLIALLGAKVKLAGVSRPGSGNSNPSSSSTSASPTPSTSGSASTSSAHSSPSSS